MVRSRRVLVPQPVELAEGTTLTRRHPAVEDARHPLEQLAAHDDPDVQRMAVMAESLGYSGVLHYGYGMGEALLEAYRRQPQQLRPFIDRACGFTLEQLRGTPDLPGMKDAVRARNQLLLTVREIVAAHPKELRAGS